MKIQKNCYWLIKEERMSAICVNCAKKLNVGWFWEGEQKGYGDYDLKCEECEDLIYLRETHE